MGHCHIAPVSTWQSARTMCDCMSGYTLTHGDSRTQTFAALIHQRFWGYALIWPRQTHQLSQNLLLLPASLQGSHNTNLQLKAQQPEIYHRRLRQTCKSSVFPKNQLHATLRTCQMAFQCLLLAVNTVTGAAAAGPTETLLCLPV